MAVHYNKKTRIANKYAARLRFKRIIFLNLPIPSPSELPTLRVWSTLQQLKLFLLVIQ